MIEAVDLFCGSGGPTCGLRQSGVKVLAGVDFEKECQCPYERNNGAHRKASGSTCASVYGRMEWDKPAPTMTTQCYGFGNGRFGHPEQDRAISLREAAIIQTYPEDYVFFDENNPLSFASVGRMIGNSVPVRLGEVIGQSIQQHVKAMV